MASNAEPPTILSIPREIRNKIYFELRPKTLEVLENPSFPISGDGSFGAVNYGDWQPLLRRQQTCKQLCDEIEEETNLAISSGELELDIEIKAQFFPIYDCPPVPQKLLTGARKVAIRCPILMYRYLPDAADLKEDKAALNLDEVITHLDLFDLKLTSTAQADKLVICGETWKHLNEGEPINNTYPIHMKAQQAFVGSKLKALCEQEFNDVYPAFSGTVALRYLRWRMRDIPTSWKENREFKLNGRSAARVKEKYGGSGESLWDVMEEVTGETQFDW